MSGTRGKGWLGVWSQAAVEDVRFSCRTGRHPDDMECGGVSLHSDCGLLSFWNSRHRWFTGQPLSGVGIPEPVVYALWPFQNDVSNILAVHGNVGILRHGLACNFVQQTRKDLSKDQLHPGIDDGTASFRRLLPHGVDQVALINDHGRICGVNALSL